MRAVLNELGKKVDNKELEKLMNDLDNDGSGEIDFDEFLKGMEKLDQLSAAPDVFQTDENEPSKLEAVAKLQEDIKEQKKQNRALLNVSPHSYMRTNVERDTPVCSFIFAHARNAKFTRTR